MHITLKLWRIWWRVVLQQSLKHQTFHANEPLWSKHTYPILAWYVTCGDHCHPLIMQLLACIQGLITKMFAWSFPYAPKWVIRTAIYVLVYKPNLNAQMHLEISCRQHTWDKLSNIAKQLSGENIYNWKITCTLKVYVYNFHCCPLCKYAYGLFTSRF